MASTALTSASSSRHHVQLTLCPPAPASPPPPHPLLWVSWANASDDPRFCPQRASFVVRRDGLPKTWLPAGFSWTGHSGGMGSGPRCLQVTVAPCSDRDVGSDRLLPGPATKKGSNPRAMSPETRKARFFLFQAPSGWGGRRCRSCWSPHSLRATPADVVWCEGPEEPVFSRVRGGGCAGSREPSVLRREDGCRESEFTQCSHRLLLTQGRTRGVRCGAAH